MTNLTCSTTLCFFDQMLVDNEFYFLLSNSETTSVFTRSLIVATADSLQRHSHFGSKRVR